MRNEAVPSKVNVGGARNIARKLLKDANAAEIPIYLPKILSYLKTQHDLEVLRFPLGAVDGLLVMIDGYPTIGFNPDVSWVRRRFTIAHEIGHLLLGHVCKGPAFEDNPEAEANQFAAELLMPLSFLKADFKKECDLEKLSEKYIVSKDALCLHLMECRIL
ncbi:MAG: ImmA/IrrE family metallo-endopeptidase [Patescibacteria group bacterium]|nr:ImmA/IrrE family metallo-endopeptidase [Patescibacteria group bacterium]MDE2438124.1 ImmA/IrrE family metallo-endopeptidase [Patescibacteria group bacterium]